MSSYGLLLRSGFSSLSMECLDLVYTSTTSSDGIRSAAALVHDVLAYGYLTHNVPSHSYAVLDN